MTYDLPDAEGEALAAPLREHAEGLTLRLTLKIEKACQQMMREAAQYDRRRGVLVKADRTDVALSEDVPYGTIRYEHRELP